MDHTQIWGCPQKFPPCLETQADVNWCIVHITQISAEKHSNRSVDACLGNQTSRLSCNFCVPKVFVSTCMCCPCIPFCLQFEFYEKWDVCVVCTWCRSGVEPHMLVASQGNLKFSSQYSTLQSCHGYACLYFHFIAWSCWHLNRCTRGTRFYKLTVHCMAEKNLIWL